MISLFKSNKQKADSMKKVVFFDSKRREALEANLATTANIVTATGNVVKNHFDNLIWCTQLVWVLRYEAEARKQLCQAILKETAKREGLACEWEKGTPTAPAVKLLALEETIERPQPLSEETRINRKLCELKVKDTLTAIEDIGGAANLEVYLRTGVIYIDKKGQTAIADDAADRLNDFCTLCAETEEQAAFISTVEKMQAAARDLENAYKEICKVNVHPIARREITACGSEYDQSRYRLTSDQNGALRLTAEDTAARALITFFGLSRIRRIPKFYNNAGVYAYTAHDAAKLLGRELEALQIRRYYPEYYKTDAYTGQLEVYPKIS